MAPVPPELLSADEGSWSLWFAWYPVTIKETGRPAWLRWVLYRAKTNYHIGGYEYSTLEIEHERMTELLRKLRAFDLQ